MRKHQGALASMLQPLQPAVPSSTIVSLESVWTALGRQAPPARIPPLPNVQHMFTMDLPCVSTAR